MSAIITYRPEIDGLRSIAILPVVLFHLGVAGVAGGFVGVDVFFVISGYLITSIIHQEMQSGSFTLRQFWVRRARRILPAMFLVVLLTLFSGWYLLTPSDYESLGRSARFQAMFAANFFFWEESGYFDTAAETKPLLHMWSLAVEEQFYIFFPILLLFLHSFSGKVRISTLCLIALSSLLLSAWSLEVHPSATFYLLPMRAWELLAGALVVFIPSIQRGSRMVMPLAACAGLLAIMVAIVYYDASTPFPGPAALLPVLGTAAIIWSGSSGPVARLLSMPPFVFIGKVSYSWYLWHWPLIVFVKYSQPGSLELWQQLVLFSGSFLLACLSYYLVENPFRQKRVLNTERKVFVAALGGIVLVAMLGQQIRLHEGYPERLPEAALKYESARHRGKEEKLCEKITAEDVRSGSFCRFGNGAENGQPLFVSWGDSHSAHFFALYKDFALNQGIVFWHTAKLACSPLVGDPPSDECVRYNRAMYELVKEKRIPHVVVASRWIAQNDKIELLDGVDQEAYFRERLKAFVQRLTALGSHVWLVKQVP